MRQAITIPGMIIAAVCLLCAACSPDAGPIPSAIATAAPVDQPSPPDTEDQPTTWTVVHGGDNGAELLTECAPGSPVLATVPDGEIVSRYQKADGTCLGFASIRRADDEGWMRLRHLAGDTPVLWGTSFSVMTWADITKPLDDGGQQCVSAALDRAGAHAGLLRAPLIASTEHPWAAGVAECFGTAALTPALDVFLWSSVGFIEDEHRICAMPFVRELADLGNGLSIIRDLPRDEADSLVMRDMLAACALDPLASGIVNALGLPPDAHPDEIACLASRPFIADAMVNNSGIMFTADLIGAMLECVPDAAARLMESLLGDSISHDPDYGCLRAAVGDLAIVEALLGDATALAGINAAAPGCASAP